MSSRVTAVTTRSFVVVSLAIFSLFGFGCGGGSSNPSLSAAFTASATDPASAPHLVKLIKKTSSGSVFVVQVVIYGQDTTLDMYSFAFDIKIGDTTIVKYVPGSDVLGNALVASAGQGVLKQVGPDTSDPSHIVVGVTKTGGPPGNGIAGPSAVVIELAFQALKAGTTTLALSGSAATPSQPPAVLDSATPPAPIGAITFDLAAGSVIAVSSGGGPY